MNAFAVRLLAALTVAHLVVAQFPTPARPVPIGPPTQLVRNINTQPSLVNPGSGPHEFVRLGSFVYFFATTDATGTELFRADLATGVATLVKDVFPGAGGSSGRSLTVIGSSLWFSAFDGQHGLEPWTSDGTAAGTFMVADIRPGYEGSDPAEFFGVGAQVCFSADDGINGGELWTSDGTTRGTGLAKDINPGAASSGPQIIATAGAVAYLSADDGASGRELWQTDGRAAGTVLLRDINPGPEGSHPWTGMQQRETLRTPFLFTADDGLHGPELWRTDGTSTGTVLVKDIDPGSASSFPIIWVTTPGNTFLTADYGVFRSELWRSDGTAGGTVLVKDVQPGTEGWLGWLTAVGPTLYFVAGDLAGASALWRSDGTAAGTVTVRSFASGFTGPIADSGGYLFFAADDGQTGLEPWRSDGTTAGTLLVKDIAPGSQSSLVPVVEPVLAIPGGAVFAASDLVHGNEPWITDGTASGTRLVVDLAAPVPGSDQGASVAELTPGFDSLWFQADDGVDRTALWRTDGTESGTIKVRQFRWLRGLTAFGSLLLFGADDGSGRGAELWRSDGTAANTVLVKDINPGSGDSAAGNFLQVGSVVYFAADDGVHGSELWKTDGTAAGTVMVRDCVPGSFASWPNQLTRFGDRMVFAVRVPAWPTVGGELWVTDGTAAGTMLLKNIAHSRPENLVVVGATLLFTADDGLHGRELWRSDGTASGTSLVMDIEPGPNGSEPLRLVAAGDTLYFCASGAIWRSDGTAPGTTKVHPRCGQLFAFGTLVLFEGFDAAHGNELWRTDGTVAGTYRISDIAPGPLWSIPLSSSFGATIGSRRAWFTANDQGSTGAELWRTDGTEAGTVMVGDVNPGPRSSVPGLLTAFNGRLFFVADDGRTGPELHVADPGATALPIGGGCGAGTRVPHLAATDPVLGAAMAISVREVPGGSFGAVLVSVRIAGAPLDADCVLHLDPARLFALASFVAGPGGWSGAPTVPNDAALAGARLALQAILAPTKATRFADWTNGVLLTLDSR